MLAIVRVPLHGSACSRKPATARRPNCIFCENLRQGVRELLAKCRKVVTGHAYLPLGIPVTQMPSMLPTLPLRERCSAVSTPTLLGAVSAQPAGSVASRLRASQGAPSEQSALISCST